MTMQPRARLTRGVRRRRRTLAATAAAAVLMGSGALCLAQPATADTTKGDAVNDGAPAARAVSADPWVAEIPGNPVPHVYRFTIPTAAVTEATGIANGIVTVQGTFGPGGTWTNHDVGASGSNVSTTFGPLEPGLYHYRYTVRPAAGQDAVAFRNPAAPQEVTSQPALSTLFVPGPGAEWLADVDGGGTLDTLEYPVGPDDDAEALVWTPPDYDADRARPYPVVYLLPDEGQGHRDWAELGRARQILDNLTLGGDAEPMVVVMADGAAADARGGTRHLLRAAERGYNVSDRGRARAIAGIGHGARQALRAVADNPGEFGWAGSFSGGFERHLSRKAAARVNRSTELLRLYAGNVTDPGYDDTVALARTLTRAGVTFQSDGSDPATGGTWETWRKNLRDFAGRVFSGTSDDGPGEGHLPLTPHEFPAPGTTPTPWTDENGVTTFELGPEFAGARDVTLWGNFGKAGSWPRTPMERQADGSWRVSFPLEGGSYYYKFVVDGVSHKDDANPTRVTSEPTWSTFTVDGDTLRGRYTAQVPPEARGEVSVMPYTSTANGQERSAYVWTPPGYDADRAEPYPVFYLQHGGGQTWTDWLEVGRIDRILDNLSLRGEIEPMVVVMGNGNGVDFPAEITTRIAPAAQDRFNVSSDPSRRALAGLSMGSGHTLSTLWAHPGEFAYIGAMSAFGAPPAGVDVEAVNEGTKLLRVYSGDAQDFTYPFTLQLVAAMKDRGVDHEFAPIVPGPHGWDVWQKSVIDFLPRLFREDAGA